MEEEREAVRLIIDSLKEAGEQWFRNAIDADIFERRITGKFNVFEGGEHHSLPKQAKGNLPTNQILIMPPSGKHKEEILGLWMCWNFEDDPFEFRLFIGQWAIVKGSKTFLAFRYEAPELGDKHNFYHCQPCRNFGDKVEVPNAALVSEHFPTIPIAASNIVELTVCALLACMGHKNLFEFRKKMLMSSHNDTQQLRKAFLRFRSSSAP